jgi:hypothetical protein
LWAKWVPSAHDRASATLRQARHRKLKAIVSTIQDQIDAMEAELMPAAAFYEGNRAFATYVRNLFMGIAEIAPEVTGKSPGEVFDILHKAVDEALGALQQTNVVGEKGALAMRGAEPARDLSAMSSKDFADPQNQSTRPPAGTDPIERARRAGRYREVAAPAAGRDPARPHKFAAPADQGGRINGRP